MSSSLIRLKKHEEKRLLQGHLWIYSNEIDTKYSPLSSCTPGQLIEIEDSRGRWLGRGYINPHTLLSIRLLTRQPQEKIDAEFFRQRVSLALQFRQQNFPQPYYRLIYGEADLLPGLIVDRYADLLVAQITTAGMEALQEIAMTALREVLSPAAILLRNDHSMRLLEGLPQYVRAAFGNPPEQCLVIENSVSYWIAPWTGQKTGWFFDHRDNRRQLQQLVQGKRVLDVFSYVGAWAIQAAVYGASEVWAVDSSAPALAKCLDNAKLNQVQAQLHLCQQDAFVQLQEFAAAGTQFDVIILDPPAFIKRRKDHAQGCVAYRRLNTLALKLLSPQGILISASCSQHLSTTELQEIIAGSSVKAHREVQIFARGHQAPDHPICPAIPETDYLKALFCRAISRYNS
jgi:23S rRNA (cytosine1962-C5)-methyltransferase